MTVKRICLFMVAMAVLSFTGCTPKQNVEEGVNLIMDTDFGPDYDDVGAIAILNALADSGKVHILATVASTKYDHVAATLNTFNTYFGRPEIPVGVPKGNAITDKDWQHWSDTVVARYPHSVKSNNDVPDATEVYRKVLASQPDHSVTVVTTGFLTNTANLLKSEADQYSKLSGTELVRQKVKKLVCMAGGFPQGREYNVFKDSVSSRYTFDNWPTHIIFSGFEIGNKIKTGLPLIHNNSIVNSPVKDVFRISIPQAPGDSLGRMSWDETAILVAVCGAEPYYTLVEGKMITNPDGSNTWDQSGKQHFYLVEKCSPQQVEDVINRLMMHQPKK